MTAEQFKAEAKNYVEICAEVVFNLSKDVDAAMAKLAKAKEMQKSSEANSKASCRCQTCTKHGLRNPPMTPEQRVQGLYDAMGQLARRVDVAVDNGRKNRVISSLVNVTLLGELERLDKRVAKLEKPAIIVRAWRKVRDWLNAGPEPVSTYNVEHPLKREKPCKPTWEEA